MKSMKLKYYYFVLLSFAFNFGLHVMMILCY